jgi:transposase
MQDHPFNRTDFREFILSLCDVLSPDTHDICFVFDNCRIHHDEDLLDIQGMFGHESRFWPRCSPQPNPIEEIFDYVKSHIKRLFATNLRAELLGLVHLSSGIKISERKRLLLNAL